jgi:TonB family protein
VNVLSLVLALAMSISAATMLAQNKPSELVAGDPESQPGPVEKRSRPITPENPIPRRLSFVDPLYPAEAVGSGAFGTVAVLVTLDETGNTAEVRSFGSSIRVPGDVSGSLPYSGAARSFVRAAIDAVRQWVYEPPAQGPITFQVSFNFAPGSAVATQLSQDEARRTVFMTPSVAFPPGARTGGAAPGSAAPSAPSASTLAAPDGAIRVGGAVRAPVKIKDVKPVYPPIAQSARVSGIVIVEAVIGADGRVGDVRVLRSIPLLDQAAIDAVRQWEFVPTLLNGAPTAIIMTMTVNFALE